LDEQFNQLLSVRIALPLSILNKQLHIPDKHQCILWTITSKEKFTDAVCGPTEMIPGRQMLAPPTRAKLSF
jgi:hypothetical protein